MEQWLWPGVQRWLVFRGLAGVLVALFFEVLIWWARRRCLQWLQPYLARDEAWPPSHRIRRREYLQKVPLSLLRWGLEGLALLVILEVWGMDATPLALWAGLILVAAGVGLKDLWLDLMQGYLLLLEAPIAPGSWVEVDSFAGQVEEIAPRVTWLKAPDGRRHGVGNHRFRCLARAIPPPEGSEGQGERP